MKASSVGTRKMLAFGLLGALGCLVAWALGEGLLAASSGSEEEKRPSGLLAPPPPELPAKETEQPPPPAEPGAVAPPKAPPPPPPEMQKRLKEAGGKTGYIQVSLRWDNRNDLDLHCVDPSG